MSPNVLITVMTTYTKNTDSWNPSFYLVSNLKTFPGNPEPQLQWFLDDRAVMEDLYIMTMIHDITEREYHGCLQLDSPTHLYNGRYRLLAINKYGSDEREVEAHFMLEPWEGEDFSHCFDQDQLYAALHLFFFKSIFNFNQKVQNLKSLMTEN